MHGNHQEPLRSLKEIRDVGPYSSRNASKGALIQETFNLFKPLNNQIDIANLKKEVMVDNCLHKASYETRRRIWNDIYYRYLYISPLWVGRSVASATSKGISSPEFLSLVYLYYSLRDRLTFEFITEVVWNKWGDQVTLIDSNDVMRFLEENSLEHPEIRKWQDTTHKKLRSNVLSALRDFGILKGTQKKYILRPPVAAETVYHLLCILKAEGKEGRSIINAPDWRLFLWNEADVSNAFEDMAQRRWIRFEKAGRTTMLELIRAPEIHYER